MSIFVKIQLAVGSQSGRYLANRRHTAVDPDDGTGPRPLIESDLPASAS